MAKVTYLNGQVSSGLFSNWPAFVPVLQSQDFMETQLWNHLRSTFTDITEDDFTHIISILAVVHHHLIKYPLNPSRIENRDAHVSFKTLRARRKALLFNAITSLIGYSEGQPPPVTTFVKYIHSKGTPNALQKLDSRAKST
jgi:hypothetical protein